MTVFRNDNTLGASNVLFERGQSSATTRSRRPPGMRHIDYGLAILTAAALAPYPPDAPFDLSRVYQDLIAEGQLAGFEVPERFSKSARRRGCATPRRCSRSSGLSHDPQRALPAGSCGDRRPAWIATASSAWLRLLAETRARGGRLFFLGVGGSAANCSHAVNDFRKLAGFEAYRRPTMSRS